MRTRAKIAAVVANVDWWTTFPYAHHNSNRMIKLFVYTLFKYVMKLLWFIIFDTKDNAIVYDGNLDLNSKIITTAPPNVSLNRTVLVFQLAGTENEMLSPKQL